MAPTAASHRALYPLLERILLEPSKESRERAEATVASLQTDEASVHIQEVLKLIAYASECDVYRGVVLLDSSLGRSVLLNVGNDSEISSCRSLYDHLVSHIQAFIDGKYRNGLEPLYVLAGLVLMLNIFVRVNWMGPPCGISSESEKHLAAQYRDKVVPDDSDANVGLNSMDGIPDKGTSFAAFASEKAAIEFNQCCILGSPDVRCFELEAEKKSYVELIGSILAELEIDGEAVYTGIVGAPYFVAALAFLSALNGSVAVATSGNGLVDGTPSSADGGSAQFGLTTVGIWQGRVAFVWQRIVRNSMLNPCPTLFRNCVLDLGEILKLSGILPKDFYLAVCDPQLLASVDLQSKQHQKTQGLDHGTNGFLHNAIKSNVVVPLGCSDIGPLLILELALRLPYYNMAKLFQPLLAVASSSLGFSYSFTGRLGIRRKHQRNETAQLVLVTEGRNNGVDNLEKTGSEPKACEDPKSDNLTQHRNGDNTGYCENTTSCTNDNTGRCDNTTSCTNDNTGYCDSNTTIKDRYTPQDIGLLSVNDDSDILERPKLSEEYDDSSLTLTEQCLLLTHALHLLHVTPDGDELNLEFLNAIVVRCLGSNDAYPSWLLSSVALWVRCRTEYHRTKTVERATLQLYQLSDSYYESTVAPGRRLEYMWHVWSPTSWGIKREIARRMSSIGSFLTAFEIYKKLHMWEDAIQCLIIVGRKNDAKDLVMQHLNTAPTPLLWCFLGDIEGDISHYKTAWELSNGRCARAQRTLGSYYFNKGDLAAAISSLESALAINPMRESSQFLLGCCYLKRGILDRAISVFARVVSLNPSCHDAWANMCSAHLNMGNIKEAKLCIDQAVKHNPSKWEFWDIRMRIALRARDLQNICQSMEKLINLGKKTAIEPTMIAFLVESSKQFPRNHATQRMLARTLDQVTKHITDNADIWSQCARYFGFQKCYLESLECTFREYRSLETKIVDSLSQAKGDAELQREHDVAQIKRLTSCLGAMVSLLKRMSVSDRRDKRDAVLETLRSVRERVRSRIEEVNAQWKLEIDSLIESAEVEDVVCVYADE
ncbi:tetratricopeptide repeat-containing protein, putative [Babesia ovis]|uniref:Tetratricopeptide repeat-containing protein, putative n=1 Tax=Babesia ovis TaxID=5869 RepID=A0A9W5T978_BABOV|nr:tetratricopeptide repeat-containing protein, putative [Babesia ovis]